MGRPHSTAILAFITLTACFEPDTATQASTADASSTGETGTIVALSSSGQEADSGRTSANATHWEPQEASTAETVSTNSTGRDTATDTDSSTTTDNEQCASFCSESTSGVTDSPHVISTSPQNGQTAVLNDSVVTLTFSDPMDRDSVEESFALSPSLPFAHEWSSDSRTLVVRPTLPLQYAEGSSPENVQALEYTVTVSSDAMTEAGEPLAPYAATFRTMRRISNTWAAGYNPNDATTNDETVVITSASTVHECTEYELWIGEFPPQGELASARAVLTFRIGDLPDGIAEFEIATLSTVQQYVTGAPYGANGLGDLLLEHVSVPVPVQGSAYSASALATISSLSEPTNSTREQLSNVLTAIRSDYENGRRYSQYRMRFSRTQNPSTTSYLVISCEGQLARLLLQYLIP